MNVAYIPLAVGLIAAACFWFGCWFGHRLARRQGALKSPLARQLRQFADYLERDRPETKAFAVAVIEDPDKALWAGITDARGARKVGTVVALLCTRITAQRRMTALCSPAPIIEPLLHERWGSTSETRRHKEPRRYER